MVYCNSGFEVANKGCCGTGTIEIAILCNLLDAHTCTDASKYVFFDSYHPTERVYKIIVSQLMKKYINDFFWDCWFSSTHNYQLDFVLLLLLFFLMQWWLCPFFHMEYSFVTNKFFYWFHRAWPKQKGLGWVSIMWSKFNLSYVSQIHIQ